MVMSRWSDPAAFLWHNFPDRYLHIVIGKEMFSIHGKKRSGEWH